MWFRKSSCMDRFVFVSEVIGRRFIVFSVRVVRFVDAVVGLECCSLILFVRIVSSLVVLSLLFFHENVSFFVCWATDAAPLAWLCLFRSRMLNVLPSVSLCLIGMESSDGSSMPCPFVFRIDSIIYRRPEVVVSLVVFISLAGLN